VARPTLEQVMLDIAVVLSARGTCAKKKVGCVLVDTHGNILATGYNGQPRGRPHCSPIHPCPAFMDGNLSCVAIHAEMNALIRCTAPESIYTAYVTEAPCDKCRLALSNTSCRQIICLNDNGISEMVML
jgi:dCMP deaminase